MFRLRFALFLTISLALSGAICALEAQNSLSLTPLPVYLSAAAGGGTVQTTFAVTSSPNTGIPFTAAFSGAPWLSLSPSSGTTPATIVVTGNPSGLVAGAYDAAITLTSTNATAASQLVVFTVGGGPAITANPSTVLLNFAPGAAVPQQTISISTTDGSATPSYSASVSKGPWLVVNQAGSSVNVSINPALVSPGQTYVDGVEILLASGRTNSLIVPVVLVYSTAPQISVSPTSLTFNLPAGSAGGQQQTLSVTPAGATFTASATVPAGTVQWLSVSPTSGSNFVTVTAAAGSLPGGTYQGSVNITQTGGNTVTVPVTLNVSTGPTLTLSPSSLSYSFSVGGANPPDQTVIPSTTSAGFPYTVFASSQGNWLTASASNPTTPNPATVSVNAFNLAPGVYTGTVTFNATGVVNNPQSVTVTLTVTNNPTFNASPNPLVFNYQINQSVPPPQTVSVTGGAAVSFTVSASGAANGINWLLAGQPNPATPPTNFMVGVNPSGLPPSTYAGSIQLTAPNGAAQLTIPTTLNVSNVALLNLPTSFSFNFQPGQAGQSQLVTVTSTGESVSYLVSASVASPAGSNWLAAGPPNGPASSTVPSSFILAVNPVGLNGGVYRGSLLVHSSNGTPDVTIPVTLTVTAGNLTVSTNTLNFSQASGGAAPPSQTVTLGSSGAILGYTAITNVSNSIANWLSVSPNTGTTPATLTVSVNPQNFPPGNYNGTVTITAAGSTTQVVAVNLTVSQAQNLVVTPASLTFSSAAGSQAPASQIVSVTSPGGSLVGFTATPVTPGGTWLAVSPPSGTASAAATNLTVTVNPLGLNPGTYTGQIGIVGQGAANGSQVVNVTLIITGVATPSVTKIQNAASAVIGPIAPGEIISIFGTNLGPIQPATTGVSGAGFFPTTLAATQVLFDNIPAAMWYTSSTQINAIVPYEIAGRAATAMQVVYTSTASAVISLQVVPTAPGIFAGQGGQAAVFNQNGTINSAFNPAQRGTAIVMFGTGEGATNPAGVTGQVIPADPNFLKHPIAPVSVTVGGQPAEVQYAGSAPGLVSGGFQVNVLIPGGAPSGAAVPVVLTVGNASSQGVATIAIQ